MFFLLWHLAIKSVQCSYKAILNSKFVSFFCIESESSHGITFDGAKFVCLTCGSKFNHNCAAKRHFKIQHLPQPSATCHICHKDFKNAYSRDIHRAKYHGITKTMMKRAGKTTWYVVRL